MLRLVAYLFRPSGSNSVNLCQGNVEDEERLARISPKWVEKLHVIDKIAGGNTNGFLDIGGGVTLADKVTWKLSFWSHANQTLGLYLC